MMRKYPLELYKRLIISHLEGYTPFFYWKKRQHLSIQENYLESSLGIEIK